MNNFFCPYAVLKNAFPNLMCQKKIERNGTKFQNPEECFAAMCPHQDFCDCRKRPQNTRSCINCEERREKPRVAEAVKVAEPTAEETAPEEKPAEEKTEVKKTVKKATKKK
ncbi:MAG: hypothetical protein J6S14_14850 [Clostridia bacterium]|nr:hypothetical protein [Clostridia bacterium]